MTKIHTNRQPSNHAKPRTVCGTHYNSIRANISGEEVYRGVRCNAPKLRRNAPKDASIYADRTCYNCALRHKCAAFDLSRTAACSGKVEPLPPVNASDVWNIYHRVFVKP